MQETGDLSGAGFQQAALRFKYQAGNPESCAISHHNLSIYLKGQGADPAQTLAHHLADAALRIQMGSGQLQTTIDTLANLAPPAPPPPWERLQPRRTPVARAIASSGSHAPASLPLS